MRRTITIPNRFIISTTSWLAKNAGSFLVILLLLSCEDDTGLVGFKNPNKDFQVFQKEFTIPTTMFLADSIATSNTGGDDTTRILVGYADNPRFGKTTAIGYTQYFPLSTPSLYSDNAQFQSLTMTLVFDHYWAGDPGDAQQTYKVYELTDSILSYMPHYSKQPTPYGALLGQAQRIISPTAFEQNKDANRDTDTSNDIIDSLNVELDPNLGRKLLTAAMDSIGDNEIDYLVFTRFRRTFKGLAIVGEGNDKIVGFHTANSKSRITLKYKIDTTNYQLNYFFNTSSTSNGLTQYTNYTQLTTDRSGTPLSTLNSYYTPTEATDGMRYVQAGTGVYTKLDFSEVREHFKDIPIKAMSVAELRIETDQQVNSPISFVLRALKPNNRSLSATKGSTDVVGDPTTILDSDLILKHAIATGSLSRLEPIADNATTPAPIKLISTSGGVSVYTGYLTTFLQQETTLSEADFLRYFALIPQVPANAKSVNGLYFSPEKVKLKIYYTTPGTKE